MPVGQPLQGSLKKSESNFQSRPNRTSCLRNRTNKDKSDSRPVSPLSAASPFSSRRNSSEDKDFVIFPSSSKSSPTISTDDKKMASGENHISSVIKPCTSSESNTSSFPTTSLRKSASSCSNKSDKKLVVVVDDTRFMIDRNLFQSQPETMLARMFSPAMLCERGWTKPTERGEYEISVPIKSIIFKAILEYYTEGVISCPPGVEIFRLRSACEYFLIPFTPTTIKCHNLGSLMHEVSNDGAHERFIDFLEDLIMPVMVKVARNGDRECHIVVLTEDDCVEWDPEFPPMVGEEYTETVHSTQLHRFFRYIENREVAKIVLKDRGMKKIKLGIEGYPLCMDQVKLRSSGRQEVIYDFVQRSFIVMSWEKEESKSRHVDFQCVTKSKSITNLAAAAADTPQDHVLIQAEALNEHLVLRDDVELEDAVVHD